jgi:uncharacterized Zn finger protein
MPPKTSPIGLTEAALLRAAGGTSFDRGQDYVGYVHGLRVDGSTATASIQAKRVYLVDLDWSDDTPTGRCTCPHHVKGNFCKHLVAVGLVVLDASGAQEDAPSDLAANAADATEPLEEYLATLDAAELRTLVADMAARYPEVERTLQVRAAGQGGDPDSAARELTQLVQSALRTRGFIDYRRSFDVAGGAHELLDELQDHLEAGAADLARPALLKAVTRLRQITLNADDSSGSLGDACQRAADLYARSCREGNPDGVKLARWLAKFRDESPGWPQTTLPDFVAAFDDRALAAYRKAVVALDQKYPEKDKWGRFEVDQMLLELADHDGDVDAAVRLLASGEHPDFPAIVDRLVAAGREDDAFAWLERGVAEGRVSSHPGGRSYWLDPEEVVEAFLARGRVEEALELLRKELARHPGVPRFRALMDLAERVGSVAEERAHAFAVLDEQARAPYGSGAARIQIALAERDLETAWSVALEQGPGHAWQELAGALMEDHPGRAAELYQPKIDEALKVTDSARYAGIAADLALVKTLCERSGEADDFAAYLAGIRQRYGRRPSLMAALDKHGL